MSSRSYQWASDFFNYSPILANDTLAEWKSEKKEILLFLKLFPQAAMTLYLAKSW